MKEYFREYKVNLGEFITQKVLESLLMKYENELPNVITDKMHKMIDYADDRLEADKVLNNSDKYDINGIEYIAKYKYIDRM